MLGGEGAVFFQPKAHAGLEPSTFCFTVERYIALTTFAHQLISETRREKVVEGREGRADRDGRKTDGAKTKALQVKVKPCPCNNKH